MRAFNEPFTASFSESGSEGSLWDQGAWIREHGSGSWLRSIHDLRLLGRPADKRMAADAAKIRGLR
jgi:hypothetical protein